MTDRHAHEGQVLREDAGALGIGEQADPAILEAGRVVVSERDHTPDLSVKARQEAELHEKLEAVADSENQLAVAEKFLQVVEQRCAGRILQMAPAHACSLSRAKIVAIEKSPGENQEVVVIEAAVAGCDV